MMKKQPPQPQKKPAKMDMTKAEAGKLKQSLQSSKRAQKGDEALMKMMKDKKASGKDTPAYKCGGKVKKYKKGGKASCR